MTENSSFCVFIYELLTKKPCLDLVEDDVAKVPALLHDCLQGGLIGRLPNQEGQSRVCSAARAAPRVPVNFVD